MPSNKTGNKSHTSIFRYYDHNECSQSSGSSKITKMELICHWNLIFCNFCNDATMSHGLHQVTDPLEWSRGRGLDTPWGDCPVPEGGVHFNLSHTWDWVIHGVLVTSHLTTPKGQLPDEDCEIQLQRRRSCKKVSSSDRVIHIFVIILRYCWLRLV